MIEKQFLQKSLCVLLVLIIVSITGGVVHAAKKDKDKKKDPNVIDEATLQSHVMSFADRFFSIMASAFVQYDSQKPSKKNRYPVQALLTLSSSNAYIIAGESDPGVALLDIISMVTLGRMYFEEDGLTTYGQEVQPIIKGFKKAEKDIREIGRKVLTADQLNNLRIIINKWRQNNPDVTFFPGVRFSDFASDRRLSTLTRAEDPDGIFESVEVATEQVEEMRLLAERGMYLATRMPQLWGSFGELWLTRLLNNPELAKILADLSQISDISSRLATTAENLPDQISKERTAAIKQAIESISKERSNAITHLASVFSAERKAAINDFLAEEQRIKGLLSDLRQTLETGNALMEQSNTLMAHMANPFDIQDYQKTLVELSNSARELTKLANSLERVSSNIGVEQLIPQVVKAIDRAESEGEELANHTTRLILIIIGAWFVAYVIARLLIMYISNKTKASSN